MLGFKEIMKTGFELRETSEKGEGIFATKSFKVDDIVMVGVMQLNLQRKCFHRYFVSIRLYLNWF